MRAMLAAAGLLFCASSVWADEVGFSVVRVPDPPGADLKVGVWYPTDAAPSEQELGLFTQTVAPDAAPSGSGRKLIVMSHGAGGSMDGNYDTALALAHAGFVVAAPTHTGDNFRDQSRITQVADRPRAIHAVIGWMLSDWTGRTALDPEKVGVFGFSAGGFTALVAAGGVPDLAAVAPYCAGHEAVFTCRIVAQHAADTDRPANTDWIADTRIKAAVVVAPALGFTFAPDGLASVSIPVQLWRAADDRILPSPDYVEPVLAALPARPEYQVVARAGHFDFMAPCSAALARLFPEICQEEAGFDRGAFHQEFNREVVGFFERELDGR